MKKKVPFERKDKKNEGAKIKMHQFDFELTFSGLICNGEMVYLNAHYSVLLGMYGLTRSVLAFYKNWTLKTNIKHGYNYTQSWALVVFFGFFRNRKYLFL